MQRGAPEGQEIQQAWGVRENTVIFKYFTGLGSFLNRNLPRNENIGFWARTAMCGFLQQLLLWDPCLHQNLQNVLLTRLAGFP